MLLVTGHKGFVGSHMTRLLDLKKIPWVGYDLVEGNDICDARKLDGFFEMNQITEVIHLAAFAGVRRGEEYPEDYIKNNILGTQTLVSMAEKHDVKTFIFYSSSSAYGSHATLPVAEGSSLHPESLYGMTKMAGEEIVHASSIKQKFIIVPFTIYGENGRKDEVVYKWLEQYKNGKPITIYGDGSSSRGYVYVKDIVKLTVELLGPHISGFPSWAVKLNVGGSERVELSEILGVFLDKIPDLKYKYLDMPECDIKHNYANISKAKNLFGYDPKPQFITNLKRIINKELKLWRKSK